MKKAELIVRILLGLLLLVFGLNKFFNFMPMPPMSESAGDFMGALVNTGYMMYFIGLVEAVSGLLLLINKFKPLALVIVFPVLLNAFLFHLFLDIGGIGAAAMATAMNVFLFFVNKDKYDSILKV